MPSTETVPSERLSVRFLVMRKAALSSAEPGQGLDASTLAARR